MEKDKIAKPIDDFVTLYGVISVIFTRAGRPLMLNLLVTQQRIKLILDKEVVRYKNSSKK
jgi:hypothetical protein